MAEREGLVGREGGNERRKGQGGMEDVEMMAVWARLEGWRSE